MVLAGEEQEEGLEAEEEEAGNCTMKVDEEGYIE